MESDPNPFPELKLFEMPERVRRIGRFIFNRFNTEPLNSGGGPMLDRELYDTPADNPAQDTLF